MRSWQGEWSQDLTRALLGITTASLLRLKSALLTSAYKALHSALC